MAGLAAVVSDLSRHIVRAHKAWIGRVDERHERRSIGSQPREQVVVACLARLHPGTAAFLDDPEADDVFQQTHGAAVTDFIGEIRFAAGVGDERRPSLDSHKRPGAGTDIGPILATGRNSRDGGTGVMRTSSDHLNRRQTGFTGDFRPQCSQAGAGGNNPRKNPGGQTERL